MSVTELPIENALRWGYSRGYQYYPSGFGGLHGDGRYPGNTIENRNYPTVVASSDCASCRLARLVTC
jgi:hypothetical protein